MSTVDSCSIAGKPSVLDFESPSKGTNQNEAAELSDRIRDVLRGRRSYALLLSDCRGIINSMPKESIDSVITSPPYWQMREYEFDPRFSSKAIGNEENADEYVNKIVDVFQCISRVLKKSGSLWLNIGDKYNDKNLMGMPWRVALALQDKGWILRNDVIWVKMKGTQSSKDRLRNIHEHLFHFVKSRKYYYDADSILLKHTKQPTISNGRVISATGVSGDKYKRLIEESEHLSRQEKKNSLTALDKTLELMRNGQLNDLRMTIRGGQRILHSNNGSVSGRARELEEKGFFIITSHAKGYMPSDVWKIVPEDECREDAHYAVFPIELLRIPILATTPIGGIVLDPFVGTGSTVVAALKYQRKAIGIDIGRTYIETAKKRVSKMDSTYAPTSFF